MHLRHFAATTMLDAGESYRTVATILGNSEATLRLHYDGRTDVGKRKAVEVLELGNGERESSGSTAPDDARDLPNLVLLPSRG